METVGGALEHERAQCDEVTPVAHVMGSGKSRQLHKQAAKVTFYVLGRQCLLQTNQRFLVRTHWKVTGLGCEHSIILYSP